MESHIHSPCPIGIVVFSVSPASYQVAQMSLLRLYLLVVGGYFSCCLAAYVLRVDNFTFVVDDPTIILSQSAFAEQEQNRSYLSGHMIFNRSLNEIMLRASMNISRPRLPELRLFDVKLNVCHVISNVYKNRFVKIFYNSYASFLNNKPLCPIKTNFNYTLTRAYLNEEVLPELLPQCSFCMKLIFHHKSKPLAHMQLDGRLSRA
ncbi:uncharacterized protein LOC111080556 [Drosophila obscura]|uniref:uncharacterized protein LOC111080556 n=1 Tax=Drosophila obscura TaxID=7282 RepID=UPI001BB10CBF|nr:uncharacterized protein LOC111080556 [Drosophila obscura]